MGLILVHALPCPAQTVPTYRAATRLVEVSVIATDKSGAVGDLTKDDFVLYDNGKKQNIAFFEKFSRQALREAATTARASLAPGELSNRSAQSLADQGGGAVISVWDALNTGFTDQMIARKAILKTLEAVHAGDHVGIYILGSTMSVIQDFTSDSEQLRRVLETHAAWLDIGYVPPQRRVELTQTAVWQIRNHLAHLPCRKSVIWIGAGLPNGLYGADFNVYIVDPRGIAGFPELRAENTSMAELVPFSWGPALFAREKEIAASTGGIAFTYSNDIRGAIEQAISDGDLTYTVGFYVPALEEHDANEYLRKASLREGSLFHKLRVEITRPGVTARYRQSYAVAPYQAPLERRVGDAFLSPIDLTDLSISGRLASGPSTLKLPLTIGATDLGLETKGDSRSGAVDVIVVERDGKGVELSRVQRALAFDIEGQKYDAFLKSGLRFAIDLDPQSALAEVKVVVIDRTSGRIGSLTVPVER
jgi:VWFA-related protein